MKKRDFSVIVPVFNCEKYLERCILSVLNQSYDNFELILINDGSTDNSLNVLNSFAKKDKRVVVIDKPNGGVSSARNSGLDISKGKYIAFLDSDDYVDKDFLKTSYEYFHKFENIQMVGYGFYSDIEDLDFNLVSSDIITYKNVLYRSSNDIRKDLINYCDNTMLYNVVNKVYLNDIVQSNKLRFSNKYWGEDMEFNMNYLKYVNSFYNSKKCFYHYIRERAGAVSNSYKKDIFNIRKCEFYDLNDYFESWNISKNTYYEFSSRRYIERILGCIENIYAANMSFIERFNSIKLIINDPVTRKTVWHVNAKSKKVKLMIIPIKLRLTLISMLMGRTFNFVKVNFPSIFNKLKNRR